MSGKKMQGRFTIQFNLNDPQQKKVSDCLEEQGRRKTQFITNAVLCYLDREKAPLSETAALLTNPVLETLLLKLLAKVTTAGAGTNESKKALQRGSEEDRGSDDMSELSTGEPDYSALTGSLMELDKM